MTSLEVRTEDDYNKYIGVTWLLFVLPNLEVFSVLTLYLTMLGTHSNLARMTSPLLPSGVPMPHSQSLPTCSYWLPGWGWGWTPQ